MTGIRRGLILLGLTVAVIIGASLPASATFADAVAVKTTISTTTVAAPTNVVGKLTCGRPATMRPSRTRARRMPVMSRPPCRGRGARW